MNNVALSQKELFIVKEVLNRYVPEFDVYVFGSRVNGTSSKVSDLDLAIITKEPMNIEKIISLKSAFKESDLPFKVDIVDWASTKENFRKIIESCRIKLQNQSK